MAPSVQRPDPPYMQIARHIRQQIVAGELRDGEMIPSARQIMSRWGVAMATATKVLAALRSEGYVRAVPGVGTVVSSANQGHTPQDRALAAHRTGRIYPPDEHAEVRSAELVPAPPDVADALGVESGTQVIRRRRVTYRGTQSVSVSVSWFDGALAAVAPRLLITERIRQGTAGHVEETTGRAVAAGRDQVAARAATSQDAEDLGVSAGSPVLCGRTSWSDADGDVIEYGEYVSAADRWTTYDYEVALR
jgi:DNA-binding GntR family transcriptional regulator